MVGVATLAWWAALLPWISASPKADPFPFLSESPVQWVFRLLQRVRRDFFESGTCMSALERSINGKFTVYLDDPRCRSILEANSVTKKLVYGDPLDAEDTEDTEDTVAYGVEPGSVRLEDVRYDLRQIPKGLEAKMMNEFGFKVRGEDAERETEICRDMKRIAVTYLTSPKDENVRNLLRHLHNHVFPINGWNDTSLFFISGIGKPEAVVPKRTEALLKRLTSIPLRVFGMEEKVPQEHISHDELVRRLREESERERDMIISPFVETYEVLMEKVHGAVSFVSRCRTYRHAHVREAREETRQQPAEIFLHLDDDAVINWPFFFAALKAGSDLFWKREMREKLVEKQWKYTEYVAMLRNREAEAYANANEEERELTRIIDEEDDARMVGIPEEDSLPNLVNRNDCLEPDAPLMMGHVWEKAEIKRDGKYFQYNYVKGKDYAPFVNGPTTILNGPAVDRIAAAYDNDRAHYRNGDAFLGLLGDRTKVCPIHLPGVKSRVWEVPARCLLPDGKKPDRTEVLPPWLHDEIERETSDIHHCPCSFAFAAMHCAGAVSCRRDLLNRQFFPCNKTLSDAVLWNRDGTEAQHLRYFDRVADRQDPKMPLPIAPPNKLPLSFW